MNRTKGFLRECQIIYLESVDSTQEEAKRLYRMGKLYDKTLILAEEQTSGRGRHGRKWFSPKGKGLWFTFAFKPELKGSELNLVSLAASLAVVKVLEELGLKASVKWPNDVLLSGKKVCGILTEGLFEGEKMKYCLLGVGLNLRDIPGVVGSTSIERELGLNVDGQSLFERIANVLLDELSRLSFEKESVLSHYKAVCVTLGREITFQRGEKLCSGKAIDINSDGRLIVSVGDNFELLCFEEVENVR